MKLYLQERGLPWQPERYKYPVEQMLLTLFPGERPEYAQGEPAENQDSAAFTLEGEGDTVLATARVCWKGKTALGAQPISVAALRDTPERVYHVLQHALKMAFYLAGTELLGHEPPWGALTGVRPVKLPTRSMAAGATARDAKRELEEVYRVSPVRAELAVRCAQASLAIDRALRPGQVSLYIAIPFCPTRCAYCSFISADVGRSLNMVEPYLEALSREIDDAGSVLKDCGLTIHSFYMGGGTPTTLTAGQLDALLGRTKAKLPLGHCVEYTVEAGRPDTITREKLDVMRAHGVGRISINPQTLEEEVLRAIGRQHSAQDVLRAYDLARQVGFNCVNMDLIAGLPGDGGAGFTRSLEGVLALSPENVTVHTLALKKGSRLMEQGGGVPTGAGAERMLALCLERLPAAGYGPYYLYRQKYMASSLENVGWAKPGSESVYNVVMMEELQSVVSLGAGGVTKLVDREHGRILRLPNPKYPHDYLSAFKKVLAQKDEISAFYTKV